MKTTKTPLTLSTETRLHLTSFGAFRFHVQLFRPATSGNLVGMTATTEIPANIQILDVEIRRASSDDGLSFETSGKAHLRRHTVCGRRHRRQPQ
ncbi:MAG: hypothetical protein IPH50_14585 [Rhodanobacteraceae bacterium]|nr:hypothetical protein [Rhodanobacteraceae bacterium]